jgi:hypothetical protein
MTALLCVFGALAVAALVTRTKRDPLQVGEDRRTVVIDAGSWQRFGQRTETTVGLVTGQRARTR